jgi:hypothetical protein
VCSVVIARLYNTTSVNGIILLLLRRTVSLVFDAQGSTKQCALQVVSWASAILALGVVGRER